MEQITKISSEELEIKKISEETEVITRTQLLQDKDSLERTIAMNNKENERVNSEIKESVIEIDKKLELLK